MLREARPQHDTAFFFPPLTAINYGNSALADGFVTFYMAKNIEEEPVRFTCMNQAKDKLEYDGKPPGSLPMKKIAANAKRCSHGALDFLFGKQRLLFLSSPSEAAGLYARHEAKVTIDRKWIPRAMTICRLLKDLMKTLAEQRTKAARQGMHNVVVTQNGDLVERDDY
ncbi:expressed unknown protein [Seminavis robusta]|uniref:Uncharacterized protein n=1 Tax=Seminavis robusta TaxID=568900 RepID=A0A9N8EF17_9STRA|nr:expressed unknown protein [Seminavis robusta]|eukprot:Sro905_g218500.1 n/a (168) ;mRNA; f:14134-14637